MDIEFILMAEPPRRLFAEATWLQGAIVTSVFYGVALTLTSMCVRSLWNRIRSRGSGYKKDIFFLCYVIFVFACASVYQVANAQITQLGFINRRNYPGGPAAFEESNASIPINLTFVLMDWCADLLMIWRCIVVYRDTRFRIIITLFGVLIFVASFGAYITLPVCSGSLSYPSLNGQSDAWMSYSLLFPYLSVSLASTMFISGLTVLRFLDHRRRVSNVLGQALGSVYTNFVTMIIESAAIYSLCSLLYMIPYATGSPLANAFMQILGMAQGTAPLLIIYRVSEGKAWTNTQSRNTLTSASLRMRRMSANPTSTDASTTSHIRTNPMNIQVTFDVHKSRDESVIKSVEDKDEVCHAV
ncbi:hypothetical protein F5J12DRAFT_904452 [Pisolithus orientalis]|uniref:uncharacterized protein n=1 Tax=Pisolithus orientalis TaxID=936130 RepID=UPI002224FE4C|nr:uncharacterized protein F5J12DRAFT_904452 [Pisolithus orientalis]KAI6015139.1 hypothetical protein F5J12DRAFT_904452 [Pisolithus orientalis]